MTVEARAFTLVLFAILALSNNGFSLLDLTTNCGQIAGVLACAILFLPITLCAWQDDNWIIIAALIEVDSKTGVVLLSEKDLLLLFTAVAPEQKKRKNSVTWERHSPDC